MAEHTQDRVQAELERRIFHLSALNDLGKEVGALQDLGEICHTHRDYMWDILFQTP